MAEPTATHTLLEKILVPLLTAIGGGGLVAFFGWRSKRDVATTHKDGEIEKAQLGQYEKMHAWMQSQVEDLQIEVRGLMDEKNALAQRAMEAELKAREIKLDFDRLTIYYENLKAHSCYVKDCPNRIATKP